MLDVIAHHQQGLGVLTGDEGNAFIQAFTKEKCYKRQHDCYHFLGAVCSYHSSAAERYCTLFTDFLHSLGLTPTGYDRAVRLCKSVDGYDYICTHVDDFKIVAKYPETSWMEMIKATFQVKESGERDYYLGNNYIYHKEAHDLWTMGSTTFALESICHVESVHGVL